MTLDPGHHPGLRVALLILAVLASDLPGVRPAAHDESSQRQNATPTAQENPQAGAEPQARVPPQAQAQAQANRIGQASPQVQPPAGARETQMQLGGKCASKGSCSRELASRRLDLDSGSDKQACRCDQLCLAHDDCCRDARWAEPLAARLAMGAERLRSRRREWQCRRVSPLHGDVLLRASCQAAWFARQTNATEAQLTKQRCEISDWGAQQQADPMGSLMPITDLTSGVTYANSHCLRCNPAGGGAPQRRKLIYWSPLVSCSYNPDLDDRNTLYDLISSKKGQALRYSRRRNRWLVNLPARPAAANSTQASNATADEAPDGQRVCGVRAAVPESVEHFVRHCRARMVDQCPQVAANSSARANTTEETERARRECHFGHQSLVYSQTSEAVYFNLACARCNHERQVFCEPRLKKQLDGPVSRITSAPQRPGLSSPLDPLGGGGGGGPADLPDNQLEGAPELGRNGGGASFSVLIDYNGGDPSEQVGSVHRCGEAEVYDPFLLTCRDVVCGLNKRYVDGNCVPAAEGEQTNLAAGANYTGNPLAPRPAYEDPSATREDSKERLTAAATSSGSTKPSQVQVAAATSEHKRGRQTDGGGSESDARPSSSGRATTSARLEAAEQDASGGGRAQAETTSAQTEVGQASGSGATTSASAPSGTATATATPAAIKGEGANNSFAELLAGLQPDELPQPTSESRRAFAECAKILIRPEHYRLFTLADLRASSLTPAARQQEPATTRAATLAGAATLPRAITATTRRESESDARARPPDAKDPSADRAQRRALAASWERRANVWALVAPYNLTLASSQFELVRGIAPGEESSGQLKLLVCSPFRGDLVAKFKPTMVYLTTCCLAVSIASLVLFLLLYGLSTFDLRHLVVELTQAGRMDDSLRASALDSKFRGSRASSDTSYNATRSQNLSSRGVACLAAALLAAYLLFILGHHDQQRRGPEQPAAGLTSCTLIAAATFCSFLVAFNWMFLLSYDIWRTLRLATCQLRAPTMSSQSRRFLTYALCAGGLALAVAALALTLDQLDWPACPGASGDAWAAPASTSCAAQQGELERLVQAYRPGFGRRAGSCWFSNRRSLAVFFGLPVTLIMFVNLLFFLHSSFMVIKTSSRSSRRLVATNSNCSAGSLTPTLARSSASVSIHHNPQQHPQQHQAYLADQMLDFAQQNSMTTSSLSSVRTIQSNLSLRSESEFGSGDDGTPGGATVTLTGDETPPSPGAESADAAHIQIAGQIESSSRHLGEEVRLCAAAASKRHSFRSAKQESSSSLLSGSSRSIGAGSSLATNLDRRAQ